MVMRGDMAGLRYQSLTRHALALRSPTEQEIENDQEEGVSRSSLNASTLASLHRGSVSSSS